jgi:UDP-N-acetylglucosamine 2-epimerase (non-hydrolysing)
LLFPGVGGDLFLSNQFRPYDHQTKTPARHEAARAPLVAYVVGARPNFVKMGPVITAMQRRGGTRSLVVHSGQHYDKRMSDDILADLGFPAPDVSLDVGSGTHGAQTAKVLSAFEKVLLDHEPEMVVVAGDVNSTLACALAAGKLGIAVTHLESGLRSRDWAMPEEINRVLTDRLSDILLTHSPEAEANLVAEGIAADRIHFVGNTMIDSLRQLERSARERAAWLDYGVEAYEYTLVTLHRPSNVDEPGRLAAIVDSLCEVGRSAPAVFPIHPRTRARLLSDGGLARLESAGVRCIEPVGYRDFLSLQCAAGAIVTDSGGVQEESSALGIPCFTFRANTERPVTITHGTNTLLGDDPAALLGIEPLSRPPSPVAIPLWDGHASERCADVMLTALGAEARPSQLRAA